MNNENITRIELTFVNAYLIKVSEGFKLIPVWRCIGKGWKVNYCQSAAYRIN